MQQRYYDPVIGRFYSNDPVGFSADSPMMFNRYAYANNNPYKYVDPDGKAAILACIPAAPACAAAAQTTVNAVGAITIVIIGAMTESADDNQPPESEDGSKTSDREAGSDGKKGSTGGPGEGKRFKPETPEQKAGRKGSPCRYCGVKTTNQPGRPNSRERDHIDPKSRGGNNSSENEGQSCRGCNRSKGAKNPDEWPQKPKGQ